ncbi:SMC-Scp complex subunit ScpB [Legionella nagasakiensis]|uniref:SMC-Scp complex subunit ScpB n=1 Tax=Legionella nagasakiensis TaxID=535290 RepID=UPI0010554B8C|nr:SMC-Scp complex subunit ScpB [Legionella nagasakiensis]
MDDLELKLVMEALLMSSREPLSLEKIQDAFEEDQKPTRERLSLILEELANDYCHRAIELKCLAGGYCLQTKAVYSPWIARLLIEKPVKYSRALLETLAIIAYKQPVTRGDIESIRGVAVSTSMLKTLLEREWIRIAAYKDVPGKPAVYTTTKTFLDYFNLKSLNDLPSLDKMQHEQ